MKKKYLISLIIIFIGIILMFVGFMRDGIHPIYFSNHNLVVASKNKHTYHEINGKKVAAIKSINIESNVNVSIRPSSNPRVVVHDVRNNNIRVKISDDNNLNISGDSNSGFMLIGFFQDISNRVEIYLPSKTYLNYVRQYNQSGDVSIKNIDTKSVALSGGSVNLQNMAINGELKIGSTDGDVSLKNIKANNAVLNTDDGNLSVSDSYFNKGESQIVSSDGDIKLKNVGFDSLYCDTSDGNTVFNNLVANKNLKVQSEDGDISGKLVNDKNVRIFAKSDDGSTNVYQPNNYLNSKNIKNYDFYTSDGDINISK